MTAKRLAKASFCWGRRAAVAVIVSAALSYLALILFGYEPMVIVTGSMQKTIPVGSLGSSATRWIRDGSKSAT